MKKISRRSFLQASAATAAAGALAACSSSDSSTTTTTTTTTTTDDSTTEVDASVETNEYGFVIPTEAVTIQFANHMVLEDATTDFWEDFKTSFETKYPTITIEYVTAAYADILSTVVNTAGGGNMVDVMLGESSWSSTLAEAGMAAPISDVMGDEYVSDFLPGVLDAMTIDGTIYGLPMYMSPFILYYNADIFAEAGISAPPTTYDEMLAMAPTLAALTSADGNKVYPFGQTTASVAISGTCLAAMSYNFGGEVLSTDGELVTDNDGFREAFENLAEMDDMGYNPQNCLLKDLRNLFALGQLAMYYDQSWGFSTVVGIDENAADYTRSAAPLAGGSGSGDSVVSAHSLYVMNVDSAQQQAAAVLVSEIINEDTLGTFMTELNLAYPAKTSMASMDAIADSAVLSGAMDCLDCAQAMPMVAEISNIYLELATLAQNVTLSDQDFDTAYATFEKAALAYL